MPKSPATAAPAANEPAGATTSRKSTGEKLVRKTAVDLVVEALRSRILSGALPPGSPLRQEALAEELGVSRIPLREAIRHLSSEGMVDLLPHRGAYVSMLSKDEVREFFDLRLRLEPWLLHEAALQITTKELDRAEQLVQRMDKASVEEWGALNWSLHELLYTASGRPAALNIVRALHERSERYFRFQVVNAPIRQQAHDEHLALIDLCRRRKADKAQAVLEAHIADAAAQIIAIVGRLLDEPASRAA